MLISLPSMGDVVGRLFPRIAGDALRRRSASPPWCPWTPTPMGMAARILKLPVRGASRAGCSRPRNGFFQRIIDFYGRTLKTVLGVCAHDPARGVGHAVAHRVPVHRGAEGLLPRAGYRRHPGHFAGIACEPASAQMGAPSSSSSPSSCRMVPWPASPRSSGRRRQNITPTSGRMSINLKPWETEASVPRRSSQRLAAGAGESGRNTTVPGAGPEHHRR